MFSNEIAASEKFEDDDAVGRKDVSGQVVLEVEHSNQTGCLEQWQAENRTCGMPTNVLIAGKLVLARGIAQKKAGFGSDDVVEHRDWKICSGYASLPRTHCHRIAD